MICLTPTNHVRNLDEELNNDDTDSPSLTSHDLPQLPPNHLILMFTRRFLTAVQQNNIQDIVSFSEPLQKSLKSNLDF